MQFNPLFMCNFDVNLPITGDMSDWFHVWNGNWSLERLNRTLRTWWQNRRKDDYSFGTAEAKTLFPLAVELLLIFVQNNFTGPFDDVTEFEKLINDIDFDYKVFLEFGKSSTMDADNDDETITAVDLLKANNEEINVNVRLAGLLVFARDIIRSLIKYDDEHLLYHWWHFRLICVQQHLIDTLTIRLYKGMSYEIDWILAHINTMKNLEYETMVRLEFANAYMQFRRPAKADKMLNCVTQILGIDLKVTGLLAMRTKHQVQPLPQLCLKVIQNTNLLLPAASETNGITKLPKLLLLDDDTRLERIRFVNDEDNVVMTLPSMLQALLGTKLYNMKYMMPEDCLAEEELGPYVRTLLYQDYGPLQLRLNVLLLNCRLEGKQRRTVERSWKQCEEIVKLMSNKHYTVSEKLSYAFVSGIKPHWHVKMQLAEHMISLGMVKTALDVYTGINAWYEVIACYSSMELRHKAAEIIQQELDKKPTTLLYCLMGDAKNDPAYYEMAWDFSKQTSARAKAHWGNYFYQNKNYTEAIPHFKTSLLINSLQENLWPRLGYSALVTENWHLAVRAYITHTHLDPFAFESWNNLAKALIKSGDKQRAHKVLTQALKCNHNNSKIWENFLVVSLDTQHYNDVILAYSHLIDFRHHYIDLEVLTHLINAITRNDSTTTTTTTTTTGSLVVPQTKLRSDAYELLAQQCITHGSIPEIWELAARLAPSPLRKSEKLNRAYRTYTIRDALWPSNSVLSIKLLLLCNESARNAIEAISAYLANESFVMITSQLYSTRLMIESCISAIEKHAECQHFAENEHLINELKAYIVKLNEHTEARQRIMLQPKENDQLQI